MSLTLALPAANTPLVHVKTLNSGVEKYSTKALTRGQFAKLHDLEKKSADCYEQWRKHIADIEANEAHIRAEARRQGLEVGRLEVSFNPETNLIERVASVMLPAKNDNNAKVTLAKVAQLEAAQKKADAENARLKALLEAAGVNPDAKAPELPAPTVETTETATA